MTTLVSSSQEEKKEAKDRTGIFLSRYGLFDTITSRLHMCPFK